jgi:hypothetical protein
VVEVTPTSGTVRVAATLQLAAVAKDAQGTAVSGRNITWTTSNSALATVSPTGLVTGVGRGTVTITATADGRSGSASIEVTDETSLLPAAGCRDCLEIAPGGLLLTGPGQEAQLVAYLVDAAGARTKVSATFTSAKPALVTVSGAGLARAAAFGSAQVTAQANGKTSASIVVLVATPAQGAILVADTVVDGWPTAVDPRARFGVGYRYRVRLRGMSPPVGQMLVSSGSLPILGRVASVRPAGAGITEAEVEVRPLAEAFTRLGFRERIALTDLGPAAAPGYRGFWQAAGLPELAEDPLEENQFRLGPFVCEAGANVGLSLPINLVVEQAEVVPQLVADVAFEDGSNTIAVSGSLSPRVVINTTVTGSLEAELECRDRLFRIPIHRRLLGALGAIIEPKIPVGYGFKLAIKAELPGLGMRSTLDGSISLGIANVCTAAGCRWTRPVLTNNLVPRFEPSLPSLGDVRHEASVGVFAFMELELTNPITEELGAVLSEDLSLTFFDFQAGAQQKLEVASPRAQATYPDYASQASLSAFFEASSEAELEVGELLSIQLLDYREEGDTTVAETPKGDLLISDTQVRAGVGDSAGPRVLFRATIFPVTYLGAGSVEGVEFFRKRTSGPLESVCGFIQPDHPGQVEFECERGFTEDEVGTHEIYAFVTARLFGRTLASPLEIAENSLATLEVTPSCPFPGRAAPSPARADGVCGRTIEGNVDVRTTADLAALADVGAVTGRLTIHPAVASVDLRELSFLSEVGLDLIVNSSSVTSLAGMTSLRRVRGFTINAPALRSLAGLHRLEGEIVSAQISGGQLTSLDGISNLRFGHLILARTGLRSPGLTNTAVGWLEVASEPALETLAGFVPLVPGQLTGIGLTDLPVLREVPLARGVTVIGERGVTLRNVGLPSLADLAAVEHVAGGMMIDNLTAAASAAGLAGLRTIGGSLLLFPGTAPALVLPALQEVAFAVEIRQTVSCAGPQQVSLPALTTLNGSNTQFLAFRLTIEATRCPLTARLPVFTMAKPTNPAGPNTITITGSQLVGLELAATVPDAVMTVYQTGLQAASLPGMTGGTGRISVNQNPLLQTLTVAPVDVYDFAVGNNPVLSSLSASGHIRHAVGIINNPRLSTQAAQGLAFTLGPGAAKTISGNGQP